jgi:hypothetical protein
LKSLKRLEELETSLKFLKRSKLLEDLEEIETSLKRLKRLKELRMRYLNTGRRLTMISWWENTRSRCRHYRMLIGIHDFRTLFQTLWSRAVILFASARDARTVPKNELTPINPRVVDFFVIPTSAKTKTTADS